MTPALLPPGSPPVQPPAARLPLGRRPWGRQAWLSLVLHGVLIVALVWRANALLGRGGGGSAASGGGGDQRVQFFTLPAAPPITAVELPPPPKVVLTDIPPVEPLALELTAIQVPQASLSTTSPASSTGGPGTGGGRGGGAGPSVGTASGPGTGGEEGYIFPPSPRVAILPPDNAPRSVRGRPYRVQFWVDADGRVSRIAVVPEIRDERYRREFYERMTHYRFYPAKTRDGLLVPGVAFATVTP